MRPTIRIEGNHIAFSTTSEGARTALDTVKKKGWKPGPEVEQALSHLPSGPILVAVSDPRETVPSLLASLPGTLQAQINSVIASSAGGSPSGRPGGAGSGSGFGPGGAAPGAGGPGMSFGRGGQPGRSAMSGSSGAARRVGPGKSAPAPSNSATGAPQDAMLQLKVDAAKLPKAEELKALMFPGTMAVVVDNTSIRLVSRGSFPDLVSGQGVGAAFAAGFIPAFNAARARALAAAGVPPGQAAPALAPDNTPAAAQPPAASGRPGRPGGPGGPGRMGRPGGGRGPG